MSALPNYRTLRDAVSSRVAVSNAAVLGDHERKQLCIELLEEFGATHIKEQGDELIHGCLLPFKDHTDQLRNPTASLNYKKLVYNCFGCGSGGGLLWFIAICRDVSSEQARVWLEQQTKGKIDDLAALLEFYDRSYVKGGIAVPPIPRLSIQILKPWLYIHPYMTEERGVPVETLQRFLIGYHPEKDRIVIPHFWNGHLVGWQTRRLGGSGPKYKSSPDFPRDRTIYNYGPKWDTVVVVESPLSVLAKWHLCPTIEATFGNEVTDVQLGHLKRHRKVILFFDNAIEGWLATERAGEFLRPYSRVFVADNPWDADPADLAPDDFQKLLDQAVPFALWSRPRQVLPYP